MLTRLVLCVALAAGALTACGDDAIVVNDDGISSGGVKLESLEPERGSLVGGQTVLLRGEGLGGNNVVVGFGDATAADVEILSAEALLVVTPAGVASGPVDVVVANAQGFAQRNAGFTYNDLPVVASVNPDAGARIGGDTVTIVGSGFQAFDAGDNIVTFDGEPAVVVSVDSDTEITAITPPGLPAAIADVAVTNVNGTGVGEDLYEYQANGLFVSAPDPTSCRGTNNHNTSGNPQFAFLDLDDGSVIDIGLDDSLGFVKIATDGQGGIVGLQACSENLFQVDLDGGAPSLIVVTNRPSGGARHMGGLARMGNDYIVRFPVDSTQFARLSTSTGQVTPIGQPGGNPSVTPGRGGIFFEGAKMFWAGPVTTAQGTVDGVAEIDTTSGAQLGQGVPISLGSSINTATIHRGQLFAARKVSLGSKGGSGAAARIVVADRVTGVVDFVAFVPIYVGGIASGDL